MLSLFICIFLQYCFVCHSQVIGCEDRLRNDLYCVGWGVKLYSNSLRRCLKSQGNGISICVHGKDLPTCWLTAIFQMALVGCPVDFLLWVNWKGTFCDELYRNCDSRPGNAIFRELTSLMSVLVVILQVCLGSFLVVIALVSNFFSKCFWRKPFEYCC